jgi:hypothetical protein
MKRKEHHLLTSEGGSCFWRDKLEYRKLLSCTALYLLVPFLSFYFEKKIGTRSISLVVKLKINCLWSDFSSNGGAKYLFR